MNTASIAPVSVSCSMLVSLKGAQADTMDAVADMNILLDRPTFHFSEEDRYSIHAYVRAVKENLAMIEAKIPPVRL